MAYKATAVLVCGLGLCVFLGAACSDASVELGPGLGQQTGGTAMTGGVLGSGGALASGGVHATGGMARTGGSASTGGQAESGGSEMTGGVASTGGAGVGPSGSVSGIPDAELAELRQVCVDEINMYRATLSLPALERASSDRELCSDEGSKKDGDSGRAHSSAGGGNPCNTSGSWGAYPNFGSQNTCPGWSVGGRSGNATIADALKQCLRMMWDEGEPPGGEEACMQAYFDGDTACFLAHGHYLNMKSDSAAFASCGFYKMSDGAYWMNQDFGG